MAFPNIAMFNDSKLCYNNYEDSVTFFKSYDYSKLFDSIEVYADYLYSCGDLLSEMCRNCMNLPNDFTSTVEKDARFYR